MGPSSNGLPRFDHNKDNIISHAERKSYLFHAQTKEMKEIQWGHKRPIIRVLRVDHAPKEGLT